jgi:hypothetical protein
MRDGVCNDETQDTVCTRSRTGGGDHVLLTTADGQYTLYIGDVLVVERWITALRNVVNDLSTLPINNHHPFCVQSTTDRAQDTCIRP